MKDYALELISKQSGHNAKLNVMREYLQAYTLRILHDEGLFRTTAFVGGTALRFLYDLPRFSEDIDFSAANKLDYTFAGLMKKVKDELGAAGYAVSVSYNDKNTVMSSFIRFDDIMYEASISPHKSQKFSIKLEIDTNPPAGAVFRTDIINKYFPIAFLSYDVASLFAGKIHALLSRKYTKGRDFFDLGWYLTRWRDATPNIKLLENALEQSGWKGEVPGAETWKKFLYKVVSSADWKKVREDVESFLERPDDLAIMTQENILKLLQ